MAKRWGAVLLAACACLVVRAEEGPGERPWTDRLADQNVTLVVADETYNGFLVPPPTDAAFRFKLAETGDTIAIRWSSLAPEERKRVQKFFGIAVEDGRLVWGAKVKGVRLRLKSGKSVAGLECPERAQPGRRCLKSATAYYFVGAEDVEKEEPAEFSESDVYNAKEYYERKLFERPPGEDAAAHEELARLCATIGYYEKAVEHYEIEKLIDPRCEERVHALREEAAKKFSEQLAEKLYLQILADKLGGDFASALKKMEAFGRNFSESEYRTRVESLRAEVEKGFQESFSKQIVTMYYYQMGVLIRERMAKKLRLDAQGRPVPLEPGKQIATTHGHVLRGRLLEDTPEHVEIQSGDTKIEIKRKEIMAMTDCDLSEAAGAIDPTFAELKAYVTNEDDLGKDLAVRIAKLLHLDEQQVRDTWQSRFNALATYDDGVLKKTPIFVVRQTAHFGVGSWLCDGAKEIMRQKFGEPPPVAKRPANDLNNDPEASDDPEQWWKAQSSETKYEMLRAFAGMKLFRMKNLRIDPCPDCAGKGFHEILTPEGKKDVLCLTCRGLQALFKVEFE
ncbi:MAG: hypothetical protein HY291_09985 [Planctomycetes bacterium]|nr:hypothetical protein [Planctomycetota bacterium]